MDGGVLMRRWTPSSGCVHDSVGQIVVPRPFRPQILTLAHDHNMAGHLGIRKTYNRILRYFFWPGLKSDVVKFCRSCHTCQVSGKPNQLIPVAPLRPIPVAGEPFEHVIIDCVGPLPKTKSGNQYILTIMCAATHYPEAVPLRSLKARAIVRALVKFFSTFGLPKHIQSDQGSNFMSKIFAQVMSELKIKHQTSSAYHPESQGALERFHQTLKNMIRKFCTESNREWDEGLPLLLFAVRETCQESLGFSPADLVFGHTVRGPLRLLCETWLSDKPSPEMNLLDYVSSFKERLHHACDVAHESLSKAQSKMKDHYDKKSVTRIFQPGDRVLVLLPIVGSRLQAKFSGPYVVNRKLSETDYVIQTPDRKKTSRVCHINMLKKYVDLED
uniref:Gypsy retrotransposon integrase-like protein 1 n=1 Tax=Mastacembelus armatus TaxID=205130 RepID=A0A3Q3SYM0_9TELE